MLYKATPWFSGKGEDLLNIGKNRLWNFSKKLKTLKGMRKFE
jgi:hypothetical protein